MRRHDAVAVAAFVLNTYHSAKAHNASQFSAEKVTQMERKGRACLGNYGCCFFNRDESVASSEA